MQMNNNQLIVFLFLCKKENNKAIENRWVFY